jgi:hypothetical protein
MDDKNNSMDTQDYLIQLAKNLCEKFVNKVETGSARSKETYQDCKNFLSAYEQFKKVR